MVLPVNISKNLRLLLTAVTLLLVMGLNNREVTTYVAPDAATAHQLNKSAAADHGTVKQKVLLEGTASYLILELAALPNGFLHLDFPRPLPAVITFCRPGFTLAGFFKTFLLAAIQPNAP